MIIPKLLTIKKLTEVSFIFIDKMVLAQFIGAIAIIFWVISVLEKEQYKILYLQATANLIYTIQFALMGIFPAAFMDCISSIRCYIFSYKRKAGKNISKAWLILFSSLVIILGIITYNGILSLIPIIITFFYTISSWISDSKWLRIVFLIAAFVWIFYNYSVGAYVCIIGNILEIISGIVSLIKFSAKK